MAGAASAPGTCSCRPNSFPDNDLGSSPCSSFSYPAAKNHCRSRLFDLYFVPWFPQSSITTSRTFSKFTASCTIFSGVEPNLSCKSFSGAQGSRSSYRCDVVLRELRPPNELVLAVQTFQQRFLGCLFCRHGFLPSRRDASTSLGVSRRQVA